MAKRQTYDPGRSPTKLMAASPTEQANEANAQREQEIRDLYNEIIDVYGPGGTYAQSQQAMIDRQKQTDLASATQGLISSGLYGSTMTAALPAKWEESVGANARLKLEDMRTQAYTSALGQKAAFLNTIEDQSPSYETLANLSMQAASKPSQSLDSWLSQNFVRPGGGTATVPTVSPSASTANSNRQAIDEIAKRQQAYYDVVNSMSQGQKATQAPVNKKKKVQTGSTGSGSYGAYLPGTGYGVLA